MRISGSSHWLSSCICIFTRRCSSFRGVAYIIAYFAERLKQFATSGGFLRVNGGDNPRISPQKPHKKKKICKCYCISRKSLL
ncbi:hypothetical protein DXB92_01635 [Ruminococcus sp. OM06-36AC]|nr:hypothetical protein DXB92_01635 [Ruminococcus sp. OM06-36AC]